MRVLAVIPARGGSKRLPRKNLAICAGRRLIEWSIDAALQSELVTETAVSTEDDEIVAAAWPYVLASSGRLELIRRSSALATDNAPTDAVLVEALAAREAFPVGAEWKVDLVVLLQPTVPVRAPGLVDRCIARLLATGADSLFTAYPLHFVWWREDGLGEELWRSQCPRRPMRQAMEARELMWHEDGSVYVTRAELLRARGQRLGGRVELVETERTVDIDTAAELRLAEMMLLDRALREAVA